MSIISRHTPTFAGLADPARTAQIAATYRQQYVVLFLALLWITVIWLHPRSVSMLPVDDAHYYLRIAENIGALRGPTFDGLEPTSGFHPLWAYLIAPLTWLPFDPAATMRVVLSIQVGLVATGLLLVRQRTQGLLAVTTTALLLVNPYTARIVFCGQESALVFLLLAIVIRTAPNRVARSAASNDDTKLSSNHAPKHNLAGSVADSTTPPLFLTALFCIVLARLDSIVFVIATIFFLPPRHRKAAAITLVASIAVLCTYWLLQFGRIGMVSAALKTGGPIYIAKPWAVVAAIGTCMALFAKRFGIDADLRPLILFAAATAAGFAVRNTLLPEMWYLTPFFLGAILVAANIRANRATVVVACVVAAAWWTISVRLWLQRLDPETSLHHVIAAQAGEFVDATLPPDARLAGWDVGTFAWYAQRDVLGLDGLVGSWQFAERLNSDTDDLLNERTDVAYIAQAFSLRALSDGLTGYEGVDVSTWHVIWERCHTYQSALQAHRWDPRVYWVLARNAEGPTVQERVDEASICRNVLR